MIQMNLFIVSVLKFKYLIHFVLIFVYSELEVQPYSFVCVYPVVPTSLIQETILSLLNRLGTIVKNYQCMNLLLDSIDLYVYLYASTTLS